MSESDKEPDVEKADALVDEGLKLYSQGLLDQSLTKWRTALDMIPDHPRAKEYIKYVEDNRPALEDSFHLAASDAQTEDEGGPDGEAGAGGGLPEEVGGQEDEGDGQEEDEGDAGPDVAAEQEGDSEQDGDAEQEGDDEQEGDHPSSEPMARGGAAAPVGPVLLVAEPPSGRSQVPAQLLELQVRVQGVVL